MWPMRKDWVLFWISGMRDEFTSVHQSLSWHTFRDVKYPSPLPVPLINGIFCMLKRCDETESFFLLHINSNLNSPLVQRLTEDGLWTEFASGTFEHLFVRQPTTSFRLYFMTDCIMALGQHPASQPTIHPFFIHWGKGLKYAQMCNLSFPHSSCSSSSSSSSSLAFTFSGILSMSFNGLVGCLVLGFCWWHWKIPKVPVCDKHLYLI